MRMYRLGAAVRSLLDAWLFSPHCQTIADRINKTNKIDAYRSARPKEDFIL